MAWALLGMESLPALRVQVERQAMSAHDCVAAYSHLIAGLIELVFHVADAAGLPSVSRHLVALLHLVQAQEEAGQERALGALLYASGTSNEAHQQRVLHLIDAQERSLRVLDGASKTVRLFKAVLTPQQEVQTPAVESSASGAGFLTVDGDQATYYVSFSGLGSDAAAGTG